MRNAILTGVVLTTLAFPTVAMADPGHGRHGHHGEKAMEKLFDKLDLTAEQKSQIQAIRQRHQHSAKADRQALMEKRRALAALMRSPSATQAQAQALHREIQAIESRLSEARLASWFEVRQVLTPAQLERLSEIKHERKRGQGRR